MEMTPSARDFARAHIASVVGLPVDWIPGDVELEERIFAELSRSLETGTSPRDQWGNWDFSFGESNRRGELYVPWLDRPLVQLRERLLATHPEWRAEPAWPEGRPFAVCLSHDVDFVTQNPTLLRSAQTAWRDGRALWANLGDRGAVALASHSLLVSAFQIVTLRGLRHRHERTYDEWLKVEDRHGFRSTFFYFPENVSHRHLFDCHYGYGDTVRFDGRRMRVRDMMVAMRDSGWEIGLHGSYHSALEPGLLIEQKREIEGVSQRPVVSTRQHWLHYDVRVTPGLQHSAGLLADSTQGFNRNIGFRAGTAFPYACWDHEHGRALPLLEVPQHVMDGGLFTANALEYDRDLAMKHCVQLMDEVEAVGGCLTLSWHPNVIENPTYWSVYEDLLAEAARRRAWGCSVGQLHEWWTARARRLSAAPDDKRGSAEP